MSRIKMKGVVPSSQMRAPFAQHLRQPKTQRKSPVRVMKTNNVLYD